MDNTEIALLGYVAWFLVLLLTIESFRTYLVLKTNKAADTFLADGSDISPFMTRLCRAHANCYESFPFIGGILLFAIASNTTVITNALALWLLAARVAQSGMHLISGSAGFIQIRFLFFILQIAIVLYWLIRYAN